MSIDFELQIQDLVTNLQTLVYRLEELHDAEERPQQESFTQTLDEEVGTYIFAEVRWRDEADIDVSTEDAAIYVADVDFYSDVDLESPLDLTLTNDEESGFFQG